MADTGGVYLDQDLALNGLLGLDLLDNQRAALLLEHGGLVGLGDLRSHADC